MSAIETIELPDIGDYKDVPVIEILVAPGDTIAVDDPLLSLESDKATLEVPSPVAGKISELLVKIGSTVSKGDAIAKMEIEVAAPTPTPLAKPAVAEAAAAPATPAPTPAEPTPVVKAAPAAAAPAASGSAHATPSVRGFARELGVDLSGVAATGPKGRILREDVLSFVKAGLSGTGGSAATGGGFSVPAMPTYDFAKYGEVERQPLSRIQEISGENLHRNWLNIPHVTNFDEADVTELEAFRVALNSEKRDPAVKLTMTAFMVKAAAITLQAFPRFNSSLDGKELILKKYVHIGFAADTPKGLMVPVIRDCDKKGILEIGAEMSELAKKAREGKLKPSEMEGGSISISSLGGIGGTGFTPIINAPEVAIIGAARSKTQPMWDGEKFVPRQVMPVCLSWDHRVVDGAAAARFLNHLSVLLGDFRRALL